MHLTLSVQALQVVGDGQPGEDGQTLVPHVEDGADRLCEGDVEGVQVLWTNGIVERDIAGVVVQQDTNAAQVRRGLDGQFLAVVTHHPGVVAAAQDPGGRVLADPLVLRGRLVGDADRVPAKEENENDSGAVGLNAPGESFV